MANMGVFPDATDVFTRLSKRPHSLLETDMEIKEAFVCIMYDRGTDKFALNKAGLELFARKQRSYEAIPTTLDALMQYTKIAVYRGGHVWGQTLECFHCLPSPENWCWQKEKENGNWKAKWTTSTAVAVEMRM